VLGILVLPVPHEVQVVRHDSSLRLGELVPGELCQPMSLR